MQVVYLFILHLASFRAVWGLRMLHHRIPHSYPVGHDVKMTCEFDLEGEALVAVKWFRNGQEFFRYSPQERPNYMYFPTVGIKIDKRRTTNTTVVLRNLEYKSTGMFRCEILADAPRFKTVTAEAYMGVEAFYGGEDTFRCNLLLISIALLTVLIN